jgi:hypothetical protein
MISHFYLSTINLSYETGKAANVNNSSYSILSLLPFIYLIKWNKLFSYIFLFLLTIIILFGFKRGPILINIVLLFVFYLYNIKQGEKWNKLLNVILGTFAMLIIGFLYFQLVQTNEFIQSRIAVTLAGYSSHRDEIYSTLFNYWYERSSFFHQIFGNGLWYSIKINKIEAHNDWFEILTNFGLLGIIIYSLIFYNFFNIIREIKNNLEKKYLLISIFIIWFFKSLFSMGYMNIDLAVTMILLAYTLGSNNNPHQKNRIAFHEY